jgi:hypothetical protein
MHRQRVLPGARRVRHPARNLRQVGPVAAAEAAQEPLLLPPHDSPRRRRTRWPAPPRQAGGRKTAPSQARQQPPRRTSDCGSADTAHAAAGTAARTQIPAPTLAAPSHSGRPAPTPSAPRPPPPSPARRPARRRAVWPAARPDRPTVRTRTGPRRPTPPRQQSRRAPRPVWACASRNRASHARPDPNAPCAARTEAPSSSMPSAPSAESPLVYRRGAGFSAALRSIIPAPSLGSRNAGQACCNSGVRTAGRFGCLALSCAVVLFGARPAARGGLPAGLVAVLRRAALVQVSPWR